MTLDVTGKTSTGLLALRETYKKERKANLEWGEKYGNLYGTTKVVVDAAEKPTHLKRPSSLDAEIDQAELRSIIEQEKRGNIVVGSGLSKFVGGYTPKLDGAAAFQTTNSVDSTLRATVSSQLVDEDQGDRSHFRKMDWLKNYFEEATKTKNILKQSGSGTAAPGGPGAPKK